MTAPGYRLVPEDPTDEMLEAGVNKALTVSLGGDYRWRDYMADLWSTMLAAAPQPEPPADLVERARDWWGKQEAVSLANIPALLATFAQEHAAAEKARADKAEKARANEREACAQIVEKYAPASQDMMSTMIAEVLDAASAAIRARKGGGDE